MRDASERWRKKNLAAKAKLSREYAKRYPERMNARNALRRAARKGAIPQWANTEFMREVYDLARLRTKLTGIQWHVDHIVPLRSRLVCGLHWERNLQVIPAKHNLQKNNLSWEGMP